jgi:hypothetical protein
LFCQNAVCNGKSKPEGPLTLIHLYQQLVLNISVPTAGTGGSVVTPKIIPASIPVKIKSLVTLFQKNQHQRQVTLYYCICISNPRYTTTTSTSCTR